MKTGSFILSGDDKFKIQYVEQLIQENNIPSYNYQEYKENFKIADARALIKTLSVKVPQGQVRLFVIYDDVQIEAQNSLLKTLEELDDSTVVIFFSNNLLPTITSRSFQINTGKHVAEQVEFDFSLNSGSSLDERLLFLDKFFSEKREDAFGELILVVRKRMLSALQENKLADTSFAESILSKLNKYAMLIKSNNLNSRLTAEKIFLQ